MSVNLSNFRTVFSDDFANDTTLNSSLWPIQFGTASQFSFGNGGLTLTGMAGVPANPVGFLQLDDSKSAGEGYGLYQFVGYVNANQDKGIAFLLWRADDTYLDPSNPGAATEIDVLENWNNTGYSTVHYYVPDGDNNGQTNTQLPSSFNLTQPHTYALDWERGSLTFYIDGTEFYQNTTNVPLDYADGGSNEVIGAEVEGEDTTGTPSAVQLHIESISYSVPVANLPAPPAPGTTSSITLQGGQQSYSAAALTMVQAGSGSDTVSALAGQVTVTGSDGALTFFGGTGASEVNGAFGSLTVFGGTGGGSYTGGSAGHNILISQGAAGANTTLTGGAAGDEIFGSTSGNDVLVAARGRESILGGGGSSTIIGGGTASSVIFTGSGFSMVYGGNAGGDIIVGTGGVMSVIAQKGDAVFGGSGQLDVSGSTSGADSIIGGSGALDVAGRGGNMLVVAGSSTSAIQVGTGASLIFTGTGSTTVGGGSGGMELVLGSGSATVYEGGGPTVYQVVKGAAGGTDLLNNFNPGVDKIDLYGYQPSDIHVATAGGLTTLSLSDGTRIELPGISNLGSSVVS